MSSSIDRRLLQGVACALLILLSSCASIRGDAPFNESGSGVTITKYPGNKAAFKFVTDDGVVVIADPFELHEYINPAIVTVSHDHPDHNDLSDLYGTYRLMESPETLTLRGITITGVAGQHGASDGTTNVIFVYDLRGIRVAHFASQGVVPTEEMYRHIGAVDILLVQCMDSRDKLSPEQVIAVCRRLHPKIVIPEHGTPHLIERAAGFFGGQITRAPSGTLVVHRADLQSIQVPRLIDMDSAPRQ